MSHPYGSWRPKPASPRVPPQLVPPQLVPPAGRQVAAGVPISSDYHHYEGDRQDYI